MRTISIFFSLIILVTTAHYIGMLTGLTNESQGNTMSNQIKKIVFWDPQKASAMLGVDCSTYVGLVLAEEADMSSCSTTIEATESQVKDIVTLCHNEADRVLSFHEKVSVSLPVMFFRGSDYDDANAAHADGALYDSGVRLVRGALADNALKIKTLRDAVASTSKMINDGQSVPMVVCAATLPVRDKPVTVVTKEDLSGFLAEDIVQKIMR